MGPIAFIRCFLLNARLRDLENQNEMLESLLRQNLKSIQLKSSRQNTDLNHSAESINSNESINQDEKIQSENVSEKIVVEQELKSENKFADSVPLESQSTQDKTPLDSQKSPILETISETIFGTLETLKKITTISTAELHITTDSTESTESTSDSTESVSDSTESKSDFKSTTTLASSLSLPTDTVSTISQTDEEWEKNNRVMDSKSGGVIWQSVELWIGRYLLGWVAVLGFIVSAALFIRHAVQAGWVGPELKVLGIAIFGATFLCVGKYFWDKGWRRFSTMLSSAGIIILFQAGYASFAFYKLVSVSTAGVVMSLIILGSFLLSWYYKSKLLGVISILGGLAVPILVSTDNDGYVELFTYLIILNIGAVVLVNLLNRTPIGFLAFLGSQFEFWIWYSNYYPAHSVNSVLPEKLAAVLIFHVAFYLIYLADTTIAAMIPRNRITPTWDDAMRAILSPIIFFGAIWQFLRNDATLGEWLGVAAIIGALWYGLLAIFYSRRLARIWNADIERQLSVYWKIAPTAATVISLGFVAIGIPLSFDAEWQAIGWITVFAGLWYFGIRQDNKTFRTMSFVFIALGVYRLMYDIFTPLTSNDSAAYLTRSLILSFFDLPSFVAILIAIFVTIIVHRYLVSCDSGGKLRSFIPLNFQLGVVNYGFMILFLSVELIQYFAIHKKIYEQNSLWSFVLLTILWNILIFLLYEIGVVVRSFSLQNISAAAMIFIVTIKVLLDFLLRGNFVEPIFNPFCPAIILSSLIFIFVGIQSSRIDNSPNAIIKMPSFGIIGVFMLLGVLSVECHQFFLNNYSLLIPVETTIDSVSVGSSIAVGSLSILWSIYALILFVIAILFRSQVVRACSLVTLFAAIVKIVMFEMIYRPDYEIAFLNPYFLTMLVPTSLIIFCAVWTICIEKLENKTETDAFFLVGLLGVIIFWIYSSVECFEYFSMNPLGFLESDLEVQKFVAIASLPIFWAFFSGLLVLIGVLCGSVWIRGLGLLIFAAMILTIVSLTMFNRPMFEVPLWNLYFVSILIPSVVMIIVSAWKAKLRPLENLVERFCFVVVGILSIILLWASLSIECFMYFNIRVELPEYQFLARVSLTIFWAILSIVGAVIAGVFRSRVFRILSVGLIVVTLIKTLPMELWMRPSYLVPIFNPFAISFFLLAVSIIFICVYLNSTMEEKDIIERIIYSVISFCGVIFLWLVLSLECFLVVRLLQGESSEVWKAQMSLSILWSFFAGLLIFIGFVWRSSILRWMSILLFGVTLTKVLFVDMAGVHEIYRFGAVFVLAVFLSLAAWAYQRFKPEIK
ncbi:MAG: DUF2339 domain-containing protein [Planctomycetaceae bacterium]|jgi:uncharacterized membrane protein|nr:DUF2339 domain-containing protein [Planctomycetaceae bacterium]